MKKIFLVALMALVIVLPTTTFADDFTGRSLMLEYMFGFDDSKGVHGFAVRARDKHVEGHVGAWFGEGRNNGVIGLGYVVEGEEGDFNASTTWGGAVVFKKNNNYTRNAVTFTRWAFGYQPAGTGGGNDSYEVSISRYGLIGDMNMNDTSNGDTFAGFGYRHLETNATSVVVSDDGMTQIDPPNECEEVFFGEDYENEDPCYVPVY